MSGLNDASIEEVMVSDGYIKFVYQGILVAEVFALSTHGLWRSRLAGEYGGGTDFKSKAEAMAHTKNSCLQMDLKHL